MIFLIKYNNPNIDRDLIRGIIKQSYFNCHYDFILELNEDIINENNRIDVLTNEQDPQTNAQPNESNETKTNESN